MTGHLAIVGLGPGAPGLQAPEATAAIAAATDLVGYSTYLERLPAAAHQNRHASDNGEELDRARLGLELAAQGSRVAIVSSGDAGVFAMASTVFEAVEAAGSAYLHLDIVVIPGISALLAAAARLGAPLGHDFCAISLSDNLKPWPVVLRRLRLAAQAGFVIALYNPTSRARPWQLGAALDLLRDILPAGTPVAFARAISRPEERMDLATITTADPACADMSTLVLIGSPATRRIERPDGGAWLYTPRRA